MAGQAGEGTKADTPEGAVKVEPQGRSPLDAALEATETVWQGHQNDGGTLKDEDAAGPGDDADAAAAAKPPEAGEEEDLQVEAQTKRAAKPPKDDKVTFKGKTHEEEARHRAQAERWGHELNEKVTGLEEQNKSLIDRLEALEKGTTQAKPEGEDKAGTVATAKEHIRELLVKIDELDTFDPEYYNKKADLMAQLYGAKAKTVSEEDVQKLVTKAVTEQKAKEKAEKDADTAASSLAKKAVTMARKAGLDMREKDDTGEPTLDWNMFWDIAESSRAPKGISLEEQVKWVVKEVKRAKGQARAEQIRELDDADAHHRDSAVLERYGEGKTPSGTRKAPAQAFTLQQALERTRKVA